MEIKAALQKEFGKVIREVFFATENTTKFLRIEVEHRNLSDLTKISKKISLWLEKQKQWAGIYSLDIYSPGTERLLELDTLDKHIGQSVQIEMLDPIDKKITFLGTIENVNQESIVLQANVKGLLKKIVITKNKVNWIKVDTKVAKKEK